MWRMIWQVSCCRVIMVTNLVEKGKVCMVMVMLSNHGCGVLVFCGTPTPTPGLENLGTRDSDFNSRSYCVTYCLCT